MPRPIHFEIQAENTERAIKFYRELFGWEFNQWGKEPYWLVKTGEKGTPGIDGGLMPRRGPAPADMQAVNAFVCTVDVADCDATAKRVAEIGGTIVAAEDADPDGRLARLRARTPRATCSGSCRWTRTRSRRATPASSAGRAAPRPASIALSRYAA